MTDLYSQKLNSTPEEFANHLIARGPVFYSEPEKIWVVTRHKLANEVLKSSDFSADRSGFFMSKLSGCPFHKVANFFGVVKKMMVGSDAPEHTARRKLASFGISDHVLDHFSPSVETVVNHLVSTLDLEAQIDFVNQLALPLPNIVLADLFSIPADQRPDFYNWANHMTQFFGGGSENVERDAGLADSGAAELRDYFSLLINERRKNPQNDFLSHLLRNQGNLDDSEVISQAAIMLVAGTVTTTDQICNNLYVFLKRGIWSQLSEIEDPIQRERLLENAIEEATRLDPSVNFIFRVAKKDLKIGEAAISAGQLVFVGNHAVNRDESVFQDPDAFVLNRERNPHLAYGSGIHYCLGARLGRIQMKILFLKMLERFPNLDLTEEKPKRKHQSLAFSGFETLPLNTRSK